MSRTTPDPPDRADPLRVVSIVLAAVCVMPQLLGLCGAFVAMPRFEEVFARLGVPLPALTRFALSYGLSATLLALSLMVLGAAWWGRRTLRIVALVAAVFLPPLHVVLFVVAAYLPLLEIVKTLGSGGS